MNRKKKRNHGNYLQNAKMNQVSFLLFDKSTTIVVCTYTLPMLDSDFPLKSLLAQ